MFMQNVSPSEYDYVYIEDAATFSNSKICALQIIKALADSEIIFNVIYFCL